MTIDNAPIIAMRVAPALHGDDRHAKPSLPTPSSQSPHVAQAQGRSKPALSRPRLCVLARPQGHRPIQNNRSCVHAMDGNQRRRRPEHPSCRGPAMAAAASPMTMSCRPLIVDRGPLTAFACRLVSRGRAWFRAGEALLRSGQCQRRQMSKHYCTVSDRQYAPACFAWQGTETATVDDLAPVDEFHIGGRRASEDFLVSSGSLLRRMFLTLMWPWRLRASSPADTGAGSPV
jgi:hypothetical protein